METTTSILFVGAGDDNVAVNLEAAEVDSAGRVNIELADIAGCAPETAFDAVDTVLLTCTFTWSLPDDSQKEVSEHSQQTMEWRPLVA